MEIKISYISSFSRGGRGGEGGGGGYSDLAILVTLGQFIRSRINESNK